MDGSAYEKMYGGLVTIFLVLAVLAPLGVWKVIEIVIWLFRHVSIHVQ